MNETNLASVAFQLNDLDLTIEAEPRWDVEFTAVELHHRDGNGKIVYNLSTGSWEVVEDD